MCGKWYPACPYIKEGKMFLKNRDWNMNQPYDCKYVPV